MLPLIAIAIVGLYVALSMDDEGFADARRVTISSVSGVLVAGLNLSFELPSYTFERRKIGPMFVLADLRFLVAAAI